MDDAEVAIALGDENGFRIGKRDAPRVEEPEATVTTRILPASTASTCESARLGGLCHAPPAAFRARNIIAVTMTELGAVFMGPSDRKEFEGDTWRSDGLPDGRGRGFGSGRQAFRFGGV